MLHFCCFEHHKQQKKKRKTSDLTDSKFVFLVKWPLTRLYHWQLWETFFERQTLTSWLQIFFSLWSRQSAAQWCGIMWPQLRGWKSPTVSVIGLRLTLRREQESFRLFWPGYLSAVLRGKRPSRSIQVGGWSQHLERWRRGRRSEYKDRGVGGRLSREMRAPLAPCRGWVGRDISNLLKLIVGQTLSSLPSQSVVKPRPRLWRVMMNGLNVKDLKPCSDPL